MNSIHLQPTWFRQTELLIYIQACYQLCGSFKFSVKVHFIHNEGKSQHKHDLRVEQFSKRAPSKMWAGTWHFWKERTTCKTTCDVPESVHPLASSCWFQLTICFHSLFSMIPREIFFPHYENVNMISHSSCSKTDANRNATTDHFSFVSRFSSENVCH